jgi:hypothetical protein
MNETIQQYSRMSTLSKIIFSFIFIVVFVVSVTNICAFFDIGFESYGNYLLWIVSLMIFFALLPSRPYVFD